MDKEAQVKIARIIASTHSTFDERWAPATADEFYDEADDVLKTLEKLGYRKIEGEPPIIEHEQMVAEIWDLGLGLEGAEGRTPTQKERFERIAQAQRDDDIKWIRGE